MYSYFTIVTYSYESCHNQLFFTNVGSQYLPDDPAWCPVPTGSWVLNRNRTSTSYWTRAIVVKTLQAQGLLKIISSYLIKKIYLFSLGQNKLFWKSSVVQFRRIYPYCPLLANQLAVFLEETFALCHNFLIGNSRFGGMAWWVYSHFHSSFW